MMISSFDFNKECYCYSFAPPPISTITTTTTKSSRSSRLTTKSQRFTTTTTTVTTRTVPTFSTQKVSSSSSSLSLFSSSRTTTSLPLSQQQEQEEEKILLLRRSDYKEPAYWITHVNLDFNFTTDRDTTDTKKDQDEEKDIVRVTSRLTVKPNERRTYAAEVQNIKLLEKVSDFKTQIMPKGRGVNC